MSAFVGKYAGELPFWNLAFTVFSRMFYDLLYLGTCMLILNDHNTCSIRAINVHIFHYRYATLCMNLLVLALTKPYIYIFPQRS